ncbi:unnamed protein product [Choristocarpus tenellus]
MDFLLGHGNEDYEGKDTAFLDWLTENGSRFEKIQWPAMTQNGLRGAVALEHIKSGEHMVTVPWRLMLSVIHAAEDPEMGHVYKENKSLLRNDNGLALFIMQEMIRGKSSFYWPFLRILPKPGSISCWGDVSLAELQDDNLVQRSKTRAKHHRVLYDRTMEVLCERYPDLFSREQYTFELFVFAWGTIQARAFGKRLPWSCLVPFADCLNHGNVQTKYDYDVGGSKTFRLFPSGENEYLQGAEVLNSYGRRPNDNLLMEYGFAILDNEWDEVEVTCCLDTSDPLYSRKRTLLRLNSLFTSRTVRLNRSNWPSTMLHFHRCAVLTGPELEEWESTVDNLHHVSASSQFHQGPNRLDKYGILESSEDLLWGNTPVECGKCTKDPARERKEEGNCSGDIEGGQFVGKWKGFPQNTISMGNELEALKQVHIKLQIKWDGFPTTLTHDEVQYISISRP